MRGFKKQVRKAIEKIQHLLVIKKKKKEQNWSKNKGPEMNFLNLIKVSTIKPTTDIIVSVETLKTFSRD